MLEREPAKLHQSKSGRRHAARTRVLVGPAVLSGALLALGGWTRPCLPDVAARAGLGSGAFISGAIQQVLSQGVFWALLGVLALVSVPWLAAGIALLASRLYTRKVPWPAVSPRRQSSS